MEINNIHVNLVKKSTITFPNISIIIRCKNESKSIEKCIRAILSQKTNEKYEIIVIDSGSTDKTIDLAKKYNVTIYTIPSEQFQFGSSINLGIKLAEGKYCVFVSAHAIPANNVWLAELIDPMQKDERIAGTFSRQLYYDTSDFIQKRHIDETFESKNRRYKISSGTFRQNLKDICFSNASSCIKKKVGLVIPFKNVIASEDREWAYRVMKDGYEIEYVSTSLIFHVHDETPAQWYRRIYINSKALKCFAGIGINVFEIIPLWGWEVRKDIKYCRDKNIKITSSIFKEAIKYEYLYAIAHFKGSK